MNIDDKNIYNNQNNTNKRDIYDKNSNNNDNYDDYDEEPAVNTFGKENLSSQQQNYIQEEEEMPNEM